MRAPSEPFRKSAAHPADKPLCGSTTGTVFPKSNKKTRNKGTGNLLTSINESGKISYKKRRRIKKWHEYEG